MLTGMNDDFGKAVEFLQSAADHCGLYELWPCAYDGTDFHCWGNGLQLLRLQFLVCSLVCSFWFAVFSLQFLVCSFWFAVFGLQFRGFRILTSDFEAKLIFKRGEAISGNDGNL